MRNTSTLHCLREALADHAHGFDKALALAAASGIVTGLAFAAVIPTAQTLGGAETVLELGFWQWIAVLAVLAVLAGVIDYFKSAIAYNSALDFMDIALHGIGDKITSLPLGWFGKGSFPFRHARSDVHRRFPFRHIATLCITMVLWDWRIGLTWIVPLPLLWAAGKSGHFDAVVAAQTPFAHLVEFAVCQGALRSCGASHPYQPLDDALDARTANAGPGAANRSSNMAGHHDCGFAFQGSLSPLTGIACMGVSLRFSTTVVDMFSMLLGVEESRKALDYYLSPRTGFLRRSRARSSLTMFVSVTMIRPPCWMTYLGRPNRVP